MPAQTRLQVLLFMELTTALLTLAGCSSSATDSNTSEDETNNAATYSQLTSEPSMDGYAVEEPNAGTPKSDIKVSHCEAMQSPSARDLSL